MRTPNIWRFDTARFSVILDCDYEQDPDLSWDETGETQEKIANGVWDCVCFRVRVLLDGQEIAADYLGNSIYGDVRDFAREHLGIRAKSRADGCNYGAYFSDMVRTAIAEARAEIKRRTVAAPYIRAA